MPGKKLAATAKALAKQEQRLTANEEVLAELEEEIGDDEKLLAQRERICCASRLHTTSVSSKHIVVHKLICRAQRMDAFVVLASPHTGENST